MLVSPSDIKSSFYFARMVLRCVMHVGCHVLTRILFPVVTDPEDPRFDLEKLIAKWEKEA